MSANGWTLWGADLLAFIALFAWALWWDRHRGRLRCPKCWYDMLGTPGRTCPECGCTAKRDSQWRRTRRRWKSAVTALLLTAVFVVLPFWKALLVRYVEHLPNAALIMLVGRISFDDSMDEYAFDGELPSRLTEHPAYCVWRWNRAALSLWQWRALAERSDPLTGFEASRLRDVAKTFVQPPATDPIAVSPDEMLALDHDDSGLLLAALQDRLQLPRDMFGPLSERDLGVAWVEGTAEDGAAVRWYLVAGSQEFALFALRQKGGEWIFAGSYNIASKYDDPQLRVLSSDPTICEIGPISSGGTGVLRSATVWCRVDEAGVRFVHQWFAEDRMYWGGGAFNFEALGGAAALGRDERGLYMDHVMTLKITNEQVSWDSNTRCDPADVRAARELGVVFIRRGMARFRWNESEGRFIPSEAESEWTDHQVENSLCGYSEDSDATFITQKFDTLVNLATGDDPARRAWVRLALTRLEDSKVKTRLVNAIDKQTKR